MHRKYHELQVLTLDGRPIYPCLGPMDGCTYLYFWRMIFLFSRRVNTDVSVSRGMNTDRTRLIKKEAAIPDTGRRTRARWARREMRREMRIGYEREENVDSNALGQMREARMARMARRRTG